MTAQPARIIVTILTFASLLASARAGDSVPSASAASTAVASTTSAVSATADPVFAATDWPWWRGPRFDGIAPADQSPPTRWSETENVVWKSPVPGRGHGSATVVGNRVYLAAAEPADEVQSVLAFDRTDGRLVWKTEVHRGGFDKKGNAKSTHASSTPACDGRRLFINFLHDGAMFTTALDLDGNKLWETKIADFTNHQGFGSSPAVYRGLVVVSADNKGSVDGKGTGALAALDRESGRIVWRVERPAVPNYTSPIIHSIGGRDQLLFTGCDLVTSLDPLTGKTLWEVKGSTTECVTSVVTDGTRIFTTGGYPKNHMSAVLADGSGKIVWENKTRVYVPSLIAKDGHLYGVLDAGVASCWESATGNELWKERLGGTFSSSPVLVGDKLYAVDESGKTTIFRASPKGFESIADNQLGDEAFATPTIVGSRIYTRVAKTTDGKRQEWLYCLGTK